MLNKRFFLFLLFCSFLKTNTRAQQTVAELSTLPFISAAEGKLCLAYFANNLSINVSILQELDRVSGVYRNARLKGGSKGLYCFVLLPETTSDVSYALLERKFPNLRFLDPVQAPSDMTSHLKTHDTILWNSDGNIVATNIPQENLFSSIHQLISR